MKSTFNRLSTRRIVLYAFSWMAVSFVMMFIDYDPQQPVLPQWLSTMLSVALAGPASYYAATYLVPTYLYQKKVGRFIGGITLLTLGNSLVTYLIAAALYHLVTGLPMFRTLAIVLAVMEAIYLFDLMLIAASCVIKIIADRFFMEKRLLEVETEKISAELNFLRAQVNPHFLFNIMNTIYFQIDRSNMQARSSVAMLAEMMRYQLYECTTDRIAIERELAYIKNYVAMQTRRMEPGADIQVFVEEQLSGFHIAPLLLLPLVENAFKHISNYHQPDQNKFHLVISTESNSTLVVQVTNTCDPSLRTARLLDSGGMGLENLERRLSLLYPGKHSLLIDKQQKIYQATLKLHCYD